MSNMKYASSYIQIEMLLVTQTPRHSNYYSTLRYRYWYILKRKT